MKNIGIFYLIFVIMLSALPCNDEFETDYFTQTATLNIAHGIAAGELETCYPICACNCCGQSLLEIDVAIINVKPAVYALARKGTNSKFLLLQRSKNIWHPPKVV